jgi:predicted nucleic acid-binding protein
MKMLLDTSVLVAAMVEVHPAHEWAPPWLQRDKRKEVTAVVASHTLAELYSILTRLPLQPQISPALAWKLIQENVLATIEVVSLLEDDYRAILEYLSQTGIVGGATYDALIVHAALKAMVDQIATLNAKDFRRIYPDLSERIVGP